MQIVYINALLLKRDWPFLKILGQVHQRFTMKFSTESQISVLPEHNRKGGNRDQAEYSASVKMKILFI